MTEKAMRQFVECGLAKEEEYGLLKSVMQDIDFDDTEARRLGYLTFLYRAGDISEEGYHSTEIYKTAKKDGRI